MARSFGMNRRSSAPHHSIPKLVPSGKIGPASATPWSVSSFVVERIENIHGGFVDIAIHAQDRQLRNRGVGQHVLEPAFEKFAPRPRAWPGGEEIVGRLQVRCRFSYFGWHTTEAKVAFRKSDLNFSAMRQSFGGGIPSYMGTDVVFRVAVALGGGGRNASVLRRSKFPILSGQRVRLENYTFLIAGILNARETDIYGGLRKGKTLEGPFEHVGEQLTHLCEFGSPPLQPGGNR